VVADAQTGFLVGEGDVEGVGMAVLKLLKDPACRREMGRSGRARVESNF
jgi:colanic acid/amylovoran biosynthesis glycosyltransferase